MLRSAELHYRRQQRLAAVGLAAARRAWRLGNPGSLVPALTILQGFAARDAVASVGEMLDEQDLDAPPEGEVNTTALAGVASDGRPLGSLLDSASDLFALELMTITQIADAARVGAGISITSRPKVAGYVRMLNPPSCPRCAVLAGRWYGWNQGFQRHPRCDCRHVPAQESAAGNLRVDPAAAFRAGEIKGLTKAEAKAINDGANIGRVVNARRSLYVDPAGHSLTRELTGRGGIRGPRPTPEEIYRVAGDDREGAIRSLKRFGYLL